MRRVVPHICVGVRLELLEHRQDLLRDQRLALSCGAVRDGEDFHRLRNVEADVRDSIRREVEERLEYLVLDNLEVERRGDGLDI